MASTVSQSFGHILVIAAKLECSSDSEKQELVGQCLHDLKTLQSRIIDLSLFSPNETLDDIPTRDLIYLVVPYVFSEVLGRKQTIERVSRLNSLVETEKYLQNFISLLETYNIVPEDEHTLFKGEPADLAGRRDLKISQFKKEKGLKLKIETIQKSIGRKKVFSDDDQTTDFDLISSFLLSGYPNHSSENEADLKSENDERLREATLLLLRLLYFRASTQLQTMHQELELLRNAPPSPLFGPPDDDLRDKKRESEEIDWKLDMPQRGGPDGRGPLLDSSGKPLRTFTILPSDGGKRAQLQGQVFGPGYRLPTMSVDEYLEIERQRGNIITGGGPAAQDAPTPSEQLAIDAEMDGTLKGELKEEAKRQKDENWARYADENPKGAGNTMNRG